MKCIHKPDLHWLHQGKIVNESSINQILLKSIPFTRVACVVSHFCLCASKAWDFAAECLPLSWKLEVSCDHCEATNGVRKLPRSSFEIIAVSVRSMLAKFTWTWLGLCFQCPIKMWQTWIVCIRAGFWMQHQCFCQNDSISHSMCVTY